MSGPGLVVRHGSLQTIEAALQRAHDEITSTVQSTLDRVDAEIGGWSIDSPSRMAQVEHEWQLRRCVERLGAALLDVRNALEQVREDAHETEVRNVAVIG